MKVLAVKNCNKQHRLLEYDSIKWEEVREKIRKESKKILETKLNNRDLIKTNENSGSIGSEICETISRMKERGTQINGRTNQESHDNDTVYL